MNQFERGDCCQIGFAINGQVEGFYLILRRPQRGEGLFELHLIGRRTDQIVDGNQFAGTANLAVMENILLVAIAGDRPIFTKQHGFHAALF